MNFSETRLQLRTLVVIAVAVLASIGIAVFIYMSRLPATVPKQTLIIPAAVTTDFAVPVTEILPLIKPCLFVFTDSCNTPVVRDEGRKPEATEPDATQNTGPEALAEADVYDTINNSPNRGLLSYQVPVASEAAAELFPEYQGPDAENLSVSSGLAIARVASHYNVNHRVLLALMEILNDGSGPLISGTSNFATPFFANDQGFLAQLVTVARDLQASELQYTLLVQEGGTLPTSMQYFDKEYQIGTNMNPESLALVDFLSKNIASRRNFEKAIFADFSQNVEINNGQNFIQLYKFWYLTDPQ